ncbi:hypothetical protein Tco_1150588 [Tanacetum coccineum]
MLCYLTRVEPYYIQCIKDGPFKLKTAEGADKPESQCTPNERRVVNQDQRLKIIIISCLPDDIMESVISCETTKDTWTDLDFQENSNDEVDERTSEEYLRVLDIEFHERGLLENSKQVSDYEEETRVQVLMALADDELYVGKNNARNGEWIDITMRKINILVSIDEDSDWQSYLKYINIDLNKLPNFNTRRILVLESESVNECLKLIEGASPSSELMTLTYKDHSPRERSGLGTMKHTKPETQESPNKNISGPILKSKGNPFPPCTHCGFNDHRPDDCRNYPKCEICGRYDHFTSKHNRVIQIRGGILAESSQSSESSIGVSCTTCGSNVHSTTDHNNFEHFKRGEKLQATKAKKPTKKWVHKRN